MEGKEAELKVFCATNKSEKSPLALSPGVTVNQISHANPHHDRLVPTCCMDAEYFGQKHHPRPAESREGDTRGKSCSGTASCEDENDSHFQSELDLELPLPLRSDDEWQHYRPPPPPHHHMYSYEPCRMDGRYWHSAGQHSFSPFSMNPSHRLWDDSHNWLQRHVSFRNECAAQGSVSVNVPQFCLPPVEGVSQVSVMTLSSAGAEASASHPHEKRQTISLPDECRNIFITYSSDISSEILPFVDFLTKQGFRPAIDLFDNPVRRLDINKWKDSYLKDPSTLIIIAISPKYKADIEGSVVDSHGLHTKYIHSMIQNEFIQQGSLNYRFIPLLFLDASQKLVPCWLQNTRVYRWPKDSEDLLLRLLRVERFVPPPVPLELTLIIRPVTPSTAATL